LIGELSKGLEQIEAIAMLISPAYYEWLLPTDVTGVPISKIVKYAEEGRFPVVEDILYPAIGYCVMFGILRLILTFSVFRVSSNELPLMIFL
jgi:hypothetical protein